jgi:hypothetical protein
MHGTVLFGANLCQIDAGLGYRTLCLAQLDLGIDPGIETLPRESEYLEPLLLGALRNLGKGISSFETQV